MTLVNFMKFDMEFQKPPKIVEHMELFSNFIMKRTGKMGISHDLNTIRNQERKMGL